MATGLCSFSSERRRSVDVKTTQELRISVTKHDERGWMSENRELSLFPAKGKVFSLDIPSYRTRQNFRYGQFVGNIVKELTNRE
jgi:hypothetical protein